MPQDGITPDGLGAAPWARFDPAWYGARYREAREAAGDDPAALQAHYFEVGRRQGLSPNRFFDERFYLARHQDVAAAVQAGTWQSGFDHYRARGHREERDPHWLFEERLYRRLSPDLTPEALKAGGFVNRYDHYLRFGDREGRQASLFLDPSYLLAALPPEAADAIRRTGAFHHLLGLPPGGADALPLSPYFDAAWYVGRYPEVAAAIAEGRWHGALHHYLCNPTPVEYDPLLFFSERHYLESNADVAQVVAAGGLRNGYRHFLDYGVFELRSPCPSMELAAYVGLHTDAAEAVRSGSVRDAFRHLLTLFDRVLPAPAAIAPPMAETAVLVLGMHRSGTSFLAGRLAEAGLVVPGTPVGGDAGMTESHFEPAEIVALNEAALRAGGGGWHVFLRPGIAGSAQAAVRLRQDATALLARLLAGSGDAVVKDPRLCLLLPCWLDALKDLGVRARVVVVVRQPEEVARSLEARNRFSRVHGRLLWARYNHDLAAALALRGTVPDAVLRYETMGEELPGLARTLGLPGLAQATGWRRPPERPRDGSDGTGDAVLDRIAEGIRDAGTLLAAAPALEAYLAPVEAQATLLAPLLDPQRRFRV